MAVVCVCVLFVLLPSFQKAATFAIHCCPHATCATVACLRGVISCQVYALHYYCSGGSLFVWQSRFLHEILRCCVAHLVLYHVPPNGPFHFLVLPALLLGAPFSMLGLKQNADVAHTAEVQRSQSVVWNV